MEKVEHRMILHLFAAGAMLLFASVAPAQSAGEVSKAAWVPPAGEWMKARGWRLGTFQSKTVGSAVGYYYYLPPNYATDRGKRYPVVYWLHGLNGTPASANPVVSRLDAGIKAGAAPEMILVSCTDPTKQSMWTDSKDGRVPVETVIVQELIDHVDTTLRTVATREGRAIEGYSMGGYGAAYLGLKYPETFGVVSILAGALHSPDTLNSRRGEIFRTVFGGDATYAKARSPWVLVRANADHIRGRTFVRIHVGERDRLREWNTEFHNLLTELKIDHTWFVVPDSTHNAGQFFANWPGSLFDFYAKVFAQTASESAPHTQGQPRTEEFVYKKTPQGELKIHVHCPKGWTAQDKRPAIVFFFGGGWRRGSVGQFLPHAQYLARRGMVAARADYRVKARHGTTPDKCVEDGKSAVRWLRTNAARLGIDPERIVASGGSAGGHVAACTFTISGFEADGEDVSVSSKPNLLILFNPVLNCVPIGERFGMADMAQKISPNHHLTKDTPPTVVFFGTEDRLNEGGKEFIEKAGELLFPAELYLAPGQPHGFFNRSPWRERTIDLMDRFLARQGYLRGDAVVEMPPDAPDLERWEP